MPNVFTKSDNPSFDRTAVDLRNASDQASPGDHMVHDSARDPFSSATSHLLSLGGECRIIYGKIMHSLPYANWYRVFLDEGNGDLPCCKLSADSNLQALGSREIGPLLPNNDVFVLRHPDGLYGYILGVVPPIVQDGNFVHPDWISQGSGTGIKREPHYRELFTLLAEEGGIMDFSNGRPLDSTIFDWGRIDELGGRLHMDQFMKQFAMDEVTGLFLFYHDQLTRLAGHNLDIRSGAHTESVRDDEGELQVIRGESLYPWEALGAYTANAQVRRTNSNTDVQNTKFESKYEPTDEKQIPFRRYREIGGYLGQGRVREMMLPPSSGEIHTLGTGGALQGVFREQIFPDGMYALQSAKAVVIAKRAPIPVARQLKVPEDYSDDADNPENYKASGFYGEGDDHKVADLKRENDSNAPALLTAAGVMDLHAHTFNWKGLHTFHYHAKDYQLPEESELPLNKVQGATDYSRLGSRMYMDVPDPKQLRVDHRYGNVRYYEVMSHLTLTEDGAVVISDGYGAEIKLHGGSIFFDAPGDIFFRSGRNIVNMAGQDINLRARHSVDVSSSEKDVRFKSEHNMQFLAGNGGKGAMLFENKSKGTTQDYSNKIGEDVAGTGIVFKSANAPVFCMAAGIYLRTGSSEGEIQPGDIVLDADKGKRNIQTVSRSFVRMVDSSLRDIFGIEQQKTVNYWSSNVALVNSAAQFNGNVTVAKNGMIVQGNVSIVGGHIGTENSAQYKGLVGELKNESLEKPTTFLEQLGETFESQISDAKDTRTQYTDDYYGEQKMGSDQIQKDLAFSFRNETQYSTDDFKFPEANWQRIQRLGGGGGTHWDEKIVKYQGQELMPYPGKQKWKDENTFCTLDPTLYDAALHCDKARGSDYEDASYGEFATKVPNDSYLVIQ